MFEHAERTVELFADLFRGPIPDGNQLVGIPAPGRTNDVLAMDQFKNVYVLVETRGAGRALKSRRLSSISTSSSQIYRLDVEGEPVEKSYAALVLDKDRRYLLSAFAVLATALLAQLPQSPSPQQIDGFLDTFIELFNDGQSVDPSAVKGVWGELWFISSAPDPASMLRYWHDESHSHFDFSAQGHNIELKTHEGDRSQHHFSHAQLSIASERTSVVSCLVYADNGGRTVGDLMDQIAQSLTLVQRTALVKKALGALGASIEDVAESRYSVRNENTNMVLSVSEMPIVSTDARAPITQLSYVVDMTDLLASRGSPLVAAFAQLSQLERGASGVPS